MKRSEAQKIELAFARYQEAEKRLRLLLKQKRWRCTPERLVLLRQICRYEKPFTVEQLIQDIAHGIPISNATVYNTLLCFESLGLVQKTLSMPQKGVGYELVSGATPTMRCVCRKCGKIIPLKDKRLETLLASKSVANFEVQDFALTFFGLCKKCQQEQNNPSSL